MNKIIDTGTCPGCGAQMPTPPESLWKARYHPCPNCPPVNGHAKHWRVARSDGIGGNIHFAYSDARNAKGGLSEQLRMRVTPEMKRATDRMGDDWTRAVLQKAIDGLEIVI